MKWILWIVDENDFANTILLYLPKRSIYREREKRVYHADAKLLLEFR